MQWSKTKSTLESFLCDKLQGRIKIYATVYRKFHDCPSRVWITFDNTISVAKRLVDNVLLSNDNLKISFEPNKLTVNPIIERTLYVAIMAVILGAKKS